MESSNRVVEYMKWLGHLSTAELKGILDRCIAQLREDEKKDFDLRTDFDLAIMMDTIAEILAIRWINPKLGGLNESIS